MSHEAVIVSVITSIFNVPLILWLLNRSMKKRDDLDSEIRITLTRLDRDVTIAQVKQQHLEREITQVTALTEMLNSLVRKVDKLQLDTDRAWEAIRELKGRI